LHEFEQKISVRFDSETKLRRVSHEN
jgi:hypothetical protein